MFLLAQTIDLYDFRVDSIPNGHDTTVSSTRVGEIEGESRKRKYPSDKAYFIAKEILTTERTYKKDLEVISLVSYFDQSL